MEQKIEKVLFVNPYTYYSFGTNEATVYPPIGVCYLCSVLEKEDVECKIVDANVLKLTHDKIFKEIKKFDPQIIGITSNIISARAALELGEFLRKKFPKKILIFGGPYATAEPDIILKKTKGDIVVRGEGELTIFDLIKNITHLENILGISYRAGNKIFHNKERELITDLDSVPFPAYHLLPDFRLYKSRSRKTPIGFLMGSRGCPFQCIFCNSNIFGKKFRPRSVSNILTEVELLVGRYKVKQIEILDDNFTLDEKRAEKFFDEILKRKIKVLFNFQNGIRADRVNAKLAKKMREAGVYKTMIGVESGDLGIQKRIKKSLDLKRVISTTKLLRKEGILVFCSFMVGLPGETPESLQKTIDFAIKVNPHIANFMVTVPLPQTELYKIISAEGKFTHKIDFGSNTGFYTNTLYYEIGGVNQALVNEYLSRAYKQFYFRLSKVLDMFLSIRSFNEFKWTLESTIPLLKVMGKRLGLKEK